MSLSYHCYQGVAAKQILASFCCCCNKKNHFLVNKNYRHYFHIFKIESKYFFFAVCQKPLVEKKISFPRKFYQKLFNQNLNLYKIVVLVEGFCGMLPVRSSFLAQTFIFLQINVKNCMLTMVKDVVEAIETATSTNNKEIKTQMLLSNLLIQ